jgi:hypothetical protein
LLLTDREDFDDCFAEGLKLYDSLPWQIMRFVPDDQADDTDPEMVFNPIDPSTMNFKDERLAVDETASSFGEYCKSIGSKDPNYWQKIYARIGLEYTSESPKGNTPVRSGEPRMKEPEKLSMIGTIEHHEPLWLEIARWIAVLPGAVLGAWLVYIVVNLMHWFSTDPDEWAWWATMTKEFFTNAGMGAAFVFLAAWIAPRFKVQVAFVFAGIVLFLSGAFLFAALQVRHYISILSNISLNAGAIYIAIKTSRAKGVPEL